MIQPRILELGGGKNLMTDGVNVDVAAVPSVDVVTDVTEEWPFERVSFDRIEAHHVLEHISHDELPALFRRSSEALRDGGEFYAEVPLAHSRSAKNDPTHRSTWYWRTPMYYTADDDLSYEVESNSELTLEHRNIRLFLTSGKWYARPPLLATQAVVDAEYVAD